MLKVYIVGQQSKFLTFARDSYDAMTTGFIEENSRVLGKLETRLYQQKGVLKSARRKETLCLRHITPEKAIEKSAWFHLGNQCCMSILYNLRRINEACREHVDNNFHPLPSQHVADFKIIRSRIDLLFNDTLQMIADNAPEAVTELRRHCDQIKDELSETYHKLYNQLREGNPSSMTVVYVYLNLLQETQEMVSGIRKYLRAYAKLLDSSFSSRKTAAANSFA